MTVTSAIYSGGLKVSGLSWLGDWLFWQGIFMIFLDHYRRIFKYYTEIGHDQFLPLHCS